MAAALPYNVTKVLDIIRPIVKYKFKIRACLKLLSIQIFTVKISQHKKVSMRNVLMTISSAFQVHLYG